ncbi:hypothetical protein [Gryllotalpicola koreensis]|uniref:Uncharacterized protein n=1 Tax=Gryllotalpicola koreensis TaxID=993086 RepID=A0ABP7ZPB1_9MICO
MKLRRIVIAAVAAAAVIVAAGIVVSFLPTKSGHSVAQSVLGGVPTPRADGAGGTSHQPPTPGASKPSSKSSPKQDDSLIDGVGHGGSEQIPTATPTPYRLHPTAPPASIKAADLVVAPNSKVTSKSVTSAQGTTQLVIDATTSSKPADTIAFYQGVLTSLGMTGKPLPAVGGSTAIGFSKGATTVTLTVSAHGKGSNYLIFGVLRTGA